jgi:hypothetical protein
VHYIDSEVAMLKEARHPCIIRGLAAFGPLAEVVTRRHLLTSGSRRKHGISSSRSELRQFLQGCGLNDRFLVMECPGTFAGREPHPESQTDCHIHRYCENGDINAYLVQQGQLAWPLMVKILAQEPWF